MYLLLLLLFQPQLLLSRLLHHHLLPPPPPLLVFLFVFFVFAFNFFTGEREIATELRPATYQLQLRMSKALSTVSSEQRHSEWTEVSSAVTQRIVVISSLLFLSSITYQHCRRRLAGCI